MFLNARGMCWKILCVKSLNPDTSISNEFQPNPVFAPDKLIKAYHTSLINGDWKIDIYK